MPVVVTYLAVQIEDVEGEDADLDLHILDLDVFPLSCHQLLEGQHFLFNHIPRHRLTVKNEALRPFLDPRR